MSAPFTPFASRKLVSIPDKSDAHMSQIIDGQEDVVIGVDHIARTKDKYEIT